MYKTHENEGHFLQMFIGLMKYSWFLNLLGPNVIKFLIFHCFYHHHSNALHWRFHEILNISLLLPLLLQSDFYRPHWWSNENVDILLVLPSLSNRPTFEFYVILVVEFSSAPMSLLGAPMSSQDAPRPRNDPSRHSQGPPMSPQGRPKVVVLWNSM